ncbi:hypothetical protein ONZ43_g3050 [Nemania bipapillata]|uniref:Uncharacterized protein n=1 Tax=Nemania bipapillata TaxID=110536 RepID=A0ACC2IYN1_9PEZI|nr:hypothetical protein ONZ43_g3050 [Nemania bipapillata]
MASDARSYWDPEDSDDDINISMISKRASPAQYSCETSNYYLDSLPVSAQEGYAGVSATALPHNAFEFSGPDPRNVSEKETTFAPFKLVKKYPYTYVGKSNKKKVGEYFKETLLQDRAWDFFSQCDPMALKDPLLLVPTTQFEEYLNIANHQLGVSLAIPRGAAGEQFSLTFGEWDTPRPRFLGRASDASAVDALKAYARSMTTNWDSSKPTPFRSREYVRFVCVDIEAYEREARLVTEVGLAVLDTEDLIDICPGDRGENWFSLVQAYHFRIKERCHMVNSEFVHGCPEAFDFGKSQILPFTNINSAVSKVIGDKESEDQRPVILVGHDIKQDLDYLRQIGYKYWCVPQIVDEVDTKDMFQRIERSLNGRGLATLCTELGISGHNYHNAGNDAVYTLQAMIAMAIERTISGSGKDEDSLTQGNDEWSDGDMDDGGCPKKPAPPVEYANYS